MYLLSIIIFIAIIIAIAIFCLAEDRQKSALQRAFRRFPNLSIRNVKALEKYGDEISEENWFAITANLSKVPERSRARLMKVILEREMDLEKKFTKNALRDEEDINYRINKALDDIYDDKIELPSENILHPYKAEDFVNVTYKGNGEVDRLTVDRETYENTESSYIKDMYLNQWSAAQTYNAKNEAEIKMRLQKQKDRAPEKSPNEKSREASSAMSSIRYSYEYKRREEERCRYRAWRAE